MILEVSRSFVVLVFLQDLEFGV